VAQSRPFSTRQTLGETSYRKALPRTDRVDQAPEVPGAQIKEAHKQGDVLKVRLKKAPANRARNNAAK